MKWTPLFLLLTIGFLHAQSKDNKTDFQQAVRAYNAGDFETSRSLLQIVIANDPSNKGAQNYLRMIQAKQTESTSLSNTLKKIILPKVEFRDATAKDAITYVAQQVDKQSGGKRSVNVVWMVPDDKERKVTLSLQDIPAFEAFRYIAEASDLKMEYDSYALKVKPAAVPAALEADNKPQ